MFQGCELTIDSSFKQIKAEIGVSNEHNSHFNQKNTLEREQTNKS
jgi:hypothetical protein